MTVYTQHKVLIIEDDATSMAMMKERMLDIGLETVCTDSLYQAQHVFSSSAPEEFLCAVVDYCLPDAPKGQAIDFAIESFLPTIVIADSIDEATRMNILAKSIVDYIPKESAQVFSYLSRLLVRLDRNKKIGVLVVDSSRASRSALTALLRRHNFITFDAPNSDTAIGILRANNNIKLAIIDQHNTGASALRLIAELRKNHTEQDLAIIGIAADVDRGLSARFIKSGASDYLYKPFNHEEFFCRVMQNVERIENIETIRRVANSDFLTGLPNRRHFFERVESIQKNQPDQQSLAIIDIDHFKRINDSYGHDCGDYCLKELALLVADYFADYTPARFGGEEFCVYFATTSHQEVLDTMQAFRQAVEQAKLIFEGQSIRCTVSVGVTSQAQEGLSSMLRIADEYLYKAKHSGRNQVVSD